MRAPVVFTLVAIILSIMARSVRAGTTSLVHTYGGNFGLRIPADPDATKGWMQDAVVMAPHHLMICDLNVSLNITHTAAFDLLLFVRSPGGVTVQLTESHPLSGYFAGANYSSTTFDDEAQVGIEDGTPPFTGSYRPVEPLAAFDGQDAYGPWRLRVYDAYYADTGYLDSVALIVTADAPQDIIMVPVPAAGGLILLGFGLIGRVLRHGKRDPCGTGTGLGLSR